jgi:hypothetical protein
VLTTLRTNLHALVTVFVYSSLERRPNYSRFGLARSLRDFFDEGTLRSWCL